MKKQWQREALLEAAEKLEKDQQPHTASAWFGRVLREMAKELE